MVTLPDPVGVEKEMVDKIRQFWDWPDFILGVRVHLKTDEERKWMLDAIEQGEVKDSDDISLYALQIHEDR